MKEICIPNRIVELKRIIGENVGVNDQVVCAFCNELITLAKELGDWKSVAFGYVWQADYFIYVTAQEKEAARALDFAERYINRNQPSELLEKYYTLRHVVEENAFDVGSAFHHTLKALGVAEELGLQERVGVNYGNLGSYFMDYGCYDEALQYSKKSMDILLSLENTCPRPLRILLSNLIFMYLKLDQLEDAKAAIKTLSQLPIPEEDLNLFVDRAWLLYYGQNGDKEKSQFYLDKMFSDGMLKLSSRAFIIAFLTDGIEAMMLTGNKEKAEELLLVLERHMGVDEPGPRLALCHLRICFVQRFQQQEELPYYYRQYYDLYEKAQMRVQKLKVEGLQAKVQLGDVNSELDKSTDELKSLADMANLDSLTKIYNRRYLNIQLDETLNSQEASQIGFAFMDIDYFKEYNDYYGHIKGDQVLEEIAECLQKNASEGIFVTRYGGDEFVCFCTGTACHDLGKYVAKAKEELGRRNIEHVKSRCSDKITLSIGYGSRTVNTRLEMINLFDGIDEALYEAKKKGRNCIVATPAMEVKP